MSKILPINLEDLLYCRAVESERVEFKASWDPKTTGFQVLKTICAFANDLHNLNGGYVVIGIEESGGQAVLPPSGLSADEIEGAQKWISGRCTRLNPPYHPILSPEAVEDRRILVVWAPASETRSAHRAPGDDGGPWRYWVRLGAETVDAEKRGQLPALMEKSARVPWDDRRTHDAQVEDLREIKAREFLRDIRSELLAEPKGEHLFRSMQITAKVNDHEVPRNVGLLFFSNDPTEWFRGAKIEVAQFAADRAGEVLQQKNFGGSLADQLRDCLNYLENLSTFHLQKQRHQSQVRSWVNYPLLALRETLVNAVYHRSYDVDQPEPTKVYLYPDRIEVVSYPGPVAGIEPRHLLPNAEIPTVPARNRRIGEFLKKLRLAEGWHTGLPKVFRSMKTNGSPLPRFDFDEQRTYFRATLPAHPEYVAMSALSDAAYLRAAGEPEDAFRRIESAWKSNQASAVLASEMIRAYAKSAKLDRAEEVLKIFEAEGSASAVAHVANTMIEVLMAAGDEIKARQLLKKMQPASLGQDAISTAILARRVKEYGTAHRFFVLAGDAVYDDSRLLVEFARTKIKLATNARQDQQDDLKRRFLVEAQELLERAIQLDASPAHHAWAWRELALIRCWLRSPVGDVEDAYRRAIELLPDEQQFREELDRVLKR